MKINKYIPFTFMLFLSSIVPTYAACTKEDYDAFKKVEDEYTVKYSFNKETKDYIVTFYGTMFDKYGYTTPEKMNLEKLVTSTNTSFAYSGIKSGEYVIEVLGYTEECQETLKTITLKLPKYNSLSEDPLCEGIEEFVLCQPTYDKDIDYETFVSRVNTYKKTKEKEPEEIIEEPEETKPIEELLEYIKNNLFQIIVITVFIILLIITTIITAKSIRKSRRLE